MATAFLNTIQRLSSSLIHSFDLFLMSSIPSSPPETPLKPTMAVDNENLTPKSRPSDDPSGTGTKEPAAETPSKDLEQSKPRSVVQVPFTLPHDDHEDTPVQKNVLQIEQIRSDPSTDQTQVADDDRQAEIDTPPSSDPDQPMDWDEFESCYKKVIQKANDEEDALLAEFEKYFEVSQLSLLLF